MKLAVIIPVHNEEKFLERVLHSFKNQTRKVDEIIVVNDHSTDRSKAIIEKFLALDTRFKLVDIKSSDEHLPGSKVINAFYKGYETIDLEYDLIGKFDADIVLPKNYFEKMIQLFSQDERIGLAGGNLYIEKNNQFIYENISSKKKVRGSYKII